ncbi:putative nucleoporin, partial [Podospora fimiseda]
MAKLDHLLEDPPNIDEQTTFDPIIKHGHQDLVQAVAFNSYGDRCATGSVDGKIRVFNRHKDGVWRHCDNWTAHSAEITELQWLPPTIYPNLLASLGMEGRFKLWAEDPHAGPGRRFSCAQPRTPFWAVNAATSGTATPGGSATPRPGTSTPGGTTAGSVDTPPSQISSSGDLPTTNPSGPGGISATPKAAFETRNSRAPYRSFSLKHIDETRHTYLALLASDGHLTIYENEQPENLSDFTQVDELVVSRTTPPAVRGEESSFKVMFDPNMEVCYTALRAGVPQDALGLVTVAMDCVRVWRTKDVITQNLGVASVTKAFYLAAEVPIGVHKGLVRDVAWAGGNVRGYDVIATAGQDGWVRVFRVDTPTELEFAKREVMRSFKSSFDEEEEEDDNVMMGKNSRDDIGYGSSHGGGIKSSGVHQEKRGISGYAMGGQTSAVGGAGQVRHMIAEISRMNNHKTPVWRVGFDDDGQILGSVGDEGRLMHYRQLPNGEWAKSSELAMIKLRMAVP